MGGVVKALIEAVEGKTFLDLRLAENRAVSRARALAPPPAVVLMLSDATNEKATRARPSPGPAPRRTFRRFCRTRASV